jgi:predicted Zn finger-like uncharacterized protein
MPFGTQCPHCQASYKLPDATNGKKVRCAKCNSAFVAVAPETAVPVEAARPAQVRQQDPPVQAPILEALEGIQEEGTEPRSPRKKTAKRNRNARSGEQGSDLYRVALFQKAVLVCVVANIGLAICRAFLPTDLALLFLIAALLVALTSAVFVCLLSAALYGTVRAIIMGVLALIPLVGLIVLLVLNAGATRLLKDNDVRVGFLGASLSEARRRSRQDGSSGGSRSSPLVVVGSVAGVATMLFVGVGLLVWLGSDLFEGDWPEPTPQITGKDVVTLHIANVGNEYTYDAIFEKIHGLTDTRSSSTVVRKGDRMTVKLRPVADPKAVAERIEFGKVRNVSGQTIRVDAFKVEGPGANADELAKALFDLNSRTRQQQAMKLIKEMPPNDRRAEVGRALEPILSGNNYGTRRMAAEIVAAWNIKEEAPLLLRLLDDKKVPMHDDIIEALAELKDERAIEPIAKCLETGIDRQSAANALAKFGPTAEKATVERLKHADRITRQAACAVLKEIGGPDSIPALEAAAKQDGTNRAAKKRYDDAIKAIRDRSK